jgi:uncharacterized membrane protein YkoI
MTMKIGVAAAIAAAAVAGGTVVYLVEDAIDPDTYGQPEQAQADTGTAAQPARGTPDTDRPTEDPAVATDEQTDAAPAQALDAAQAAQAAVTEVPGTVVDTWPGTEAGRDVWYVDVQTANGAVLEVYVDATTGDVLDVEPD